MFKIERILVPVDFSERSITAAKHALALADRFHSNLIFAHVIPPAPPEYAGFEGGYPWVTSAGPDEESFRYFLTKMESLEPATTANGRVQRVVSKGDPARELVRLASEHHVDLIVMPTHGYGLFRRFVLGSVTAKVLHDVDCPVLTGVHMEVATEPMRPHQCVACAVDFRPHSEGSPVGG